MASFIVYGDASGQVTVQAPAVAGSNTITFPAETGTLVTSASTISALPGQIAWNTTVQTTGFTAVAYGGYFCNTTSAAFTVTLPATPTRGQFVVIVDYAGTAASNNITVSGNGANINGGSGSFVLSTNRAGVTVTYIDSTQGWVASSNVYGANPGVTYSASYLVVAGGGGGGANGGAGGGAGGLLTGTATLSVGTIYTATIGAGGNGGSSAALPVNRGDSGSSSFISGNNLTTITATGGGGGGGGGAGVANGLSGGSGGGGGGGISGTGGSGTSGQGNAGGNGNVGSGGGGGASATGVSGTSGVGGNGGNGSSSSISGSSVTYAGGGGGRGTTSGTGGTGGGGAGQSSGTGTTGTINTGGGGGGSTEGGAGGSGVVIISVPTSSYSGTTTGSPTVSTSGANTILTYTASGTYTA